MIPLKTVRDNWVVFVLIGLCIISGCKGDTGPTGPQGPPGESLEYNIQFQKPHPIIRADGTSSLPLIVRITAFNNAVANLTVTFTIISGSGTITPLQVNTNLGGEASCTYTSGTVPGKVIVAASINYSGYKLSQLDTLYIDSLNVSLPLLTKNFKYPLRAYMSPNGQTIIFETTQDNDCGLYKISSQGGSPQYVGQFRGGMFDPGGSGKIAVYNADGKFGTIDESGTVIDTFRRPPNFYGEIRNVGWNFSGNRFLVASNTNALFYVCDLTNQANDTYFYAPVWVYGTSPIPQTNQVVIHGSAEYTSGIFSIDISTGNSTLIRTTGSGWWDTYIPINGVSVHPTRNTVLYSTIPTEESNSSTQCDIFEIPLAGGEVNTVLGSPADELYPQWSTDGTKILFCSNRSAKGYNLYFYTPSIVQ